MSDLPRRHSFAEDVVLDARTGPRRRDSDWGGHPRTQEEDLAWAAKRAAISMATAALHARDGDTGDHSDDVVHLCDAIADELGIHGHDRAELLAAAQLHDVGKVAIPREVLEKPGPLDDREWAQIREHTITGQQIVQSVPELDEVARVVRHSHERWDGGGYPDGLAGESIPLASRIVFCADAFHAIRSDRSYRRGRAAEAALEEVTRSAGTQFDPDVAEALVKCAGRMRQGARSPATGRGSTLRSRRLLSLLLTLAIGGSALAAGGSQVLREQGDPGTKKTAQPSSPAPAEHGATRTAGSAAIGRRPAPRKAAERPRAASDTRTPGAPARSSKSPASGRQGASVPQAAAPGGVPLAATRRGARRPASPGRSEEAPRRPAQPGRPVGGAPGRSEEAPGRPSQPVKLPAASQPGLGKKAPAALPRGVAKPR
ncbi:MAG TPA: HD domain-containing phosphohydrolase [Thermoleophilaceae bacterium]|nr:HD domain-containing phosphohydrolase [Thermoleophilaceae bacterium]